MVDDSDKDPRQHFIKQRRNLIGISLFVIFYKVGNLQINEINFFGNKTTITNHDAVLFFLAVFFIYFLWRYYTAFKEIGGLSNFFRVCSVWVEKKAQRSIHKETCKKYPGVKNRGWSPELITRHWYVLEYNVCTAFDIYGDGHRQLERLVFRVIALRVFSPFYAIIQTSSFSEYILPFVLAILAACEYWGWGPIDWLITVSNPFSGSK